MSAPGERAPDALAPGDPAQGDPARGARVPSAAGADAAGVPGTRSVPPPPAERDRPPARGPVLTPEIEAAVRARAKAELRRRVRAVRAKLPPEARAARSAAVVERLRALPSYQAANCVALYVALRSEVDLGPLLADAASCGKRVALPRVEAGDRALALHAYLPGDPLEPSAFGVLEPRPSAPRIDPADVALVVVPGLVFDERGHRVGYGAGYYDRLLPTLDRAARVGVAFDFQLVAEVPDTAGDVPVDVVVTDRRVVSARREAP